MEDFVYVIKFYDSDDVDVGMITTSAENAARLLLCMMTDGTASAYPDYNYEEIVNHYVGNVEKWTQDVIDNLNTYHIYSNDEWFIKAIPITTTEEIEDCEENLKNGYSIYDALV